MVEQVSEAWAQCFSDRGNGDDWLRLWIRLAPRRRRHLQKPNGCFRFRIGQGFPNRDSKPLDAVFQLAPGRLAPSLHFRD
jgi:hypothetical protein